MQFKPFEGHEVLCVKVARPFRRQAKEGCGQITLRAIICIVYRSCVTEWRVQPCRSKCIKACHGSGTLVAILSDPRSGLGRERGRLPAEGAPQHCGVLEVDREALQEARQLQRLWGHLGQQLALYPDALRRRLRDTDPTAYHRAHRLR